MTSIAHRSAAAAMALALAGCAGVPDDGLLSSTAAVATLERETGDVIEVARFSQRLAGAALPAHWQPWIVLPAKPRTGYRLVASGDEVALEAQADRSASGLYRKIRIDPRSHPLLEWRWKVSGLIPGADKRVASREDSPARLLVSFHGDAQNLDMFTRGQMRFATALSGQALPYATLMYVWSNEVPADAVLPNPHLDRIRMIVVESGPKRVGQWLEFRRNVLEDYRRAFGEEPWDIVAVGVMTDSDNTQQKARCLYGDISFRRE